MDCLWAGAYRKDAKGYHMITVILNSVARLDMGRSLS